MTFSESATKLFGQTALLLGWRPDDFWEATPAELVAIIATFSPETGAVDGAALSQLMMQFPDARSGGE